MKTCCRCEDDKPLSEFNKDRTSKDEHKGFCKGCRKTEYQQNKSRYQDSGKRYYQENRDDVLEYHRTYREKNPEKRKEACRNWYQQNKDYSSQYHANRYLLNRDQILEQNRLYRLSNPESGRSKESRRRSRLRGNGSYTSEDKSLSLLYRRIIQDDPCFYCGQASSHDDHYIPISKGGTDHWWNLVRACESCNLRKSAKLPWEFITQLNMEYQNV